MASRHGLEIEADQRAHLGIFYRSDQFSIARAGVPAFSVATGMKIKGKPAEFARNAKQTFNDEESETLLRGFLSGELYRRGLICRADDRGDPVIQISPPLVATQVEFDQITGILGDVLAEAWERLA